MYKAQKQKLTKTHEGKLTSGEVETQLSRYSRHFEFIELNSRSKFRSFVENRIYSILRDTICENIIFLRMDQSVRMREHRSSNICITNNHRFMLINWRFNRALFPDKPFANIFMQIRI